MDRREFLIKFISGAVGMSSMALINIDKCLEDTKHLSDGDFVAYISTYTNLWVHNPAYCVRITDIGEP